MTFGELAIKDKFRSSSVPGVRFRKAPNGMGECLEDPNKSQFFWDTAVVDPITDVKPAEQVVVETVANETAAGGDESGAEGASTEGQTGSENVNASGDEGKTDPPVDTGKGKANKKN